MKAAKALLLSVVFAHAAVASGSKRPKEHEPVPPMDRDTTPVELTPETLRRRLIEENLDVRFASNSVHKAKVNVSVARANLLPNLNLGVAVGSLVDPSFILASVESFLPFLMPSRWFEMFQAEQLLEADKKSYHVLQLNTYSSAYSLYITILNDQQLLRLFETDLADWRRIEEITEIENNLGRATDNDLATAAAQRALADYRVENLRGLIERETADLAQALGYHPDKPVTLKNVSVPRSEHEQGRFDPIHQLAYDRAIERQQIDYLIEAEKFGKWARAFSFIGGASVSARADQAAGETSPDFAFEKLQVGGFLNFSWGTFGLIKLSNLNIEELKLRKEEISRELTRTLRVALKTYPALVASYERAKEAEDRLRANYERNQGDYEIGRIAFRDLLLSRLSIADATTSRIRAETDLNLLRIVLHRTFRTAQFTEIEGCKTPNTKKNRKKLGLEGKKNLGYCLAAQT